MHQVRMGGSWAAAVVIGAVWAGAALGQYKPVDYTPPPTPFYSSPASDPDYDRREHDYAQNWWDNQQKQQPQSSWWFGNGDPEAPTAEHLMTWMTVLLFAAMAVLLLWVGARVFVRLALRPTDPAKLAMSDPWVRAHLGRSGAQPPPTQTP